MSTFKTKDGRKPVLQRLGQGAAGAVQPRLAAGCRYVGTASSTSSPSAATASSRLTAAALVAPISRGKATITTLLPTIFTGLIEHLQLDEVTLVGFSMGGGDVSRYIGRYGTAKVKGLVLLGAVTPIFGKTDDHSEGVEAAVFDGIKAGFAEGSCAVYQRVSPRRFTAPTRARRFPMGC